MKLRQIAFYKKLAEELMLCWCRIIDINFCVNLYLFVLLAKVRLAIKTNIWPHLICGENHLCSILLIVIVFNQWEGLIRTFWPIRGEQMNWMISCDIRTGAPVLFFQFLVTLTKTIKKSNNFPFLRSFVKMHQELIEGN